MKIYLDNASTTQIDDEVSKCLYNSSIEIYGNPSSIHSIGQKAKVAIEEARSSIAQLLGASTSEMLFLGSGSEANNLVLDNFNSAAIFALEHSSIIEKGKSMVREGKKVYMIPSTTSGVIDLGYLSDLLDKENIELISLQHVNNELGTIQPIEEVVALAKDRGILVHCDGIQAIGKLDVNLLELGVDYYSCSSHKFYGPKGIGILYLKKGAQLSKNTFGGYQERNRRAGTENVPSIIASELALKKVLDNREARQSTIEELRQYLEQELTNKIDNIIVNCRDSNRVPNISSITFKNIKADILLFKLDMLGICVSAGSACGSGSLDPSYVLTNLGLTKEDALSTIRFSLGKYNNKNELEYVVQSVVECVENIRGGI